MKTPGTPFSRRILAAFTLIEMIGVLAILTILAGIMTPNILHSIELAAVQAEAQNLRNLDTAIGLYVRDNGGVMPIEGAGNWNVQLATYSSLSAANILTNTRQSPAAGGVQRLYVIDPLSAAPNQRALLISSMRYQVALPTAAQAKANFAGIWNTADNTVPPGAGWGSWGAGPAPALNNVQYLVIDRVSVSSVYHTYFGTYSWSLNNTSSTDTVSCIVTWASGAAPTTYSLVPNSSIAAAALPVLKPGDKLAFYKAGSPVVLFNYVVSDSNKTFTYATSTYWSAQ